MIMHDKDLPYDGKKLVSDIERFLKNSNRPRKIISIELDEHELEMLGVSLVISSSLLAAMHPANEQEATELVDMTMTKLMETGCLSCYRDFLMTYQEVVIETLMTIEKYEEEEDE
jgi:hypothetical protein